MIGVTADLHELTGKASLPVIYLGVKFYFISIVFNLIRGKMIYRMAFLAITGRQYHFIAERN